jgi:hypothetical protein
MRWVVIGFIGLVLAGVLTVTWALPGVYGPPKVECIDIEPAACERTWRAEAANDGVLQVLPVTEVTIWGHGDCDDGEIFRANGWFGRAWSELC